MATSRSVRRIKPSRARVRGSARDGKLPSVTFDGVLLDIDGVLAVSWEALPGAIDALARLRDEKVPFRLIANTTTKSRADLAATLRGAGFDVADEEVVTAVVATAEHLRTAHPDAPVFVLSDGDATADLVGIDLVDVDDADVIVIGGACEEVHVRHDEPDLPSIDGRGGSRWDAPEPVLEDRGRMGAGRRAYSPDSRTADTRAAICGKPEKTYFDAGLMLGVEADRAAMVGDDIVNDILGAQAAGLTGILVPGKYRAGDDARDDGRPDRVLDSFADVPAFLGSP